MEEKEDLLDEQGGVSARVDFDEKAALSDVLVKLECRLIKEML